MRGGDAKPRRAARKRQTPPPQKRAGSARARSPRSGVPQFTEPRSGSVKRNPARWPVGGENAADQVLLRDEAPGPGVAGRLPVVAHHQVVVLRDLGVLPAWRKIGEAQRPVVAAV